MLKKIICSLIFIVFIAVLYSGCANNPEDVDTAPPVVDLQSPEKGAKDIAINSPVTAKFNKRVVGLNGTTTAFTIQKVGSFGTLSAVVTYNDTTFTGTLDPVNDLEADSVYVVTINDEVKSRTGIELEPVSWTFITKPQSDSIPPTIVSKTPAADAKYILPDVKVTVEFSEALQSTSLVSENFYLMKGSVKIPSTISSSGNTVTLDPDAALEDWTEYTVTITDGIKDIAGNPLTQILWTFKTDDQNNPVIVSKNPDSGDSSVPINAVITVVLSESVKSHTLQNTGTSFMLKKDFGDYSQITASVIYNDSTRTVTLTPGTTLEDGKSYKVFLTDAIKDNANNALESADWTFTTSSIPDTVSPMIIFKNPESNNTGIATNPAITVRFDEIVNGVNETNFTLEKSSGGAVDSIVAYNVSTRTATLTPKLLLSEGTEYKVTLTSSIEDISGNDLDKTVWTFVTADNTRPVVLSKTPGPVGNVGSNTTVSVEFSEKMLSSTLNLSTFKLEASGAPVSGFVSYDSVTKIATFDPDVNLQYNTAYTVTLTNGITDLYNNNLNTMAWTFTTGTAPDNTVPSVLSGYPQADALRISPNTGVIITFSEPVTGVTSSNVALKLDASTTVSTQLKYDSLTNTATLIPDAVLLNNTQYTVVVTGGSGIKDAAGNILAVSEQWKFTVIPDETFPVVTYKIPAPGMPDIPGNTLEVTALFSENVTGVGSGTILLKRDSDSSYVACNVSYTADTTTNTYKAVMTPVAAIMNTGYYTVQMTSGIKDLAGNSVTPPSGWTFWITSIDDIPPTVIGRTPANAARWGTNKVQVIFSEDVKNVSGTSFYVTPTAGGSHLPSVVTYSKGLLTAELVTEAVLQYATSYTAHLTSVITDRAGLPLTSTEITWTFVTDPDTVSPTLDLDSPPTPPNGSNGVPITSLIKATFSEPIQGFGSIPGITTIYLDPWVNGTVSYDSATKTLTLLPSGNLSGNTTYTVYLKNGITDIVQAPAIPNPLANISWQFTTQNVQDTVRPTVLSVTPEGAGPFPQSANVVVKFSEDVTNATSKISLSANGTTVGANTTYSNTGGEYTATLDPTELLEPATVYTVTVRGSSTGVKDTSGNYLLADNVTTFTTAADSTAPTVTFPSVTTGVPLKPTIVITFSEAVTGVSSSSVTFNGGVYYVVYDAASHIAYVTPNTNLTNNTSYTVGLTNAIKDRSGNAIAATNWSFTTASLPVITSTVPAMNATGVSVDLSGITLNFNQAMNPLKSWVEVKDSMPAGNYYTPVTPGLITWSNGNATAVISLIGKLRAGAVYTVKLYGWGGTFEDINGNTLNRDTVISGGQLTFTAAADGTDPVINSTIPSGTGVGRNIPKILIRFSETMAAAGTATLNSTTLNGMAWAEGRRAVSFDVPAGIPRLSESTQYTVNLAGFTDLSGRALSGTSFTFTTGSSIVDSIVENSNESFESYLISPSEAYASVYTAGVFNKFKNLVNDTSWVYMDESERQVTATRDWYRTTSALAYPNYSGGFSTPLGSYIVKATDFQWDPGDKGELELINYNLNLNDAATYILSFQMVHERIYNKADNVEVHISTNGGDTYPYKLNAGTMSAVYRYDYSLANDNPVWQTHYFDLSDPVFRSSSVRIKFVGISAGETGGNIFIDDVKITKY